MNFYIEENICIPDPTKTPHALEMYRLKNDLILNKVTLDKDVGAYLNKFEKAFYNFRTFNENDTLLNLSYKNTFDVDAGFWPLRPPIPYAKQNAGFVCTKNTLVIFLYFNTIRYDVSEKLQIFLPTNCYFRKDFSHELKTPNVYRNDFYFHGKKVGAIDNYIFRDNFHFVDIVLNSNKFNQEDVNDINFLCNKYGDAYYKKSPAYTDGIGPSPLSEQEFLDLFLKTFSNILDLKLIYPNKN
jgi:hypothetical protein